jgi:hypothetical protein
MGMAHFYRIAMSFVLIFAVDFSPGINAQEAGIEELSEGSCWYQQGELLKVASFNDKTSFVARADDLDKEVVGLLASALGLKNIVEVPVDLAIHCGGYGASLVAEVELEEKSVCAWLKFEKGKLSLRSVGGRAAGKGSLCDGYKFGELIIGLQKNEDSEIFNSLFFSEMIKEVRSLSATTFKIVLKDEYIGKESEAAQTLKLHFKEAIRYIELDGFQHPVGDYKKLK